MILMSVDDPGQRDAARRLLAKRGSGLRGYYLRECGKGLEEVVDLVRLPIPTHLFLDAEGVVTGIHRGPIELN